MRHCFRSKCYSTHFDAGAIFIAMLASSRSSNNRKELLGPNVHHFIYFLYLFAICFHFEIWWPNSFFVFLFCAYTTSLPYPFPNRISSTCDTIVCVCVFAMRNYQFVIAFHFPIVLCAIHEERLSLTRSVWIPFECHWCHSESTCNNNNSNKRIKCCMEPRKCKIHVDKNIKLRYYMTDFIHTIWACHVRFRITNHLDSIRNWWQPFRCTHCIHNPCSKWMCQQCPYSLAFSL